MRNLEVRDRSGNFLFTVPADKAHDLLRTRCGRRRKPKDGKEFIQLHVTPRFPDWMFGTKYHFRERLSDTLSCWALKPATPRFYGGKPRKKRKPHAPATPPPGGRPGLGLTGTDPRTR
jgi:hypothetical protein